jgi:putative spermidine/putrescine transport system permease protein/spermidine/putrescine transport system permease protein
VVAPLVWLTVLSFQGESGGATMENYERLLASESFYRSLLTTFQISALVTILCVAMGFPLSYCLSQLPRRIAAVLLFLVLVPYWTSVLVRTYAWLVLLQRRGLVNSILIGLGVIDHPLTLANNLTGVVIGMTHVMLPFFVLPAYNSMLAIDRRIMMAATSLGASPTVAFWRVFAPLSAPGVVAGAFLVFVISIGFYITPAILGGGRVIMIAQQIETSLSLYSNWGATSALGVLLLVSSIVLLLAARLGVRKWSGGQPA